MAAKPERHKPTSIDTTQHPDIQSPPSPTDQKLMSGAFRKFATIQGVEVSGTPRPISARTVQFPLSTKAAETPKT